jgi:hypothetical protein
MPGDHGRIFRVEAFGPNRLSSKPVWTKARMDQAPDEYGLAESQLADRVSGNPAHWHPVWVSRAMTPAVSSVLMTAQQLRSSSIPTLSTPERYRRCARRSRDRVAHVVGETDVVLRPARLFDWTEVVLPVADAGPAPDICPTNDQVPV